MARDHLGAALEALEGKRAVGARLDQLVGAEHQHLGVAQGQAVRGHLAGDAGGGRSSGVRHVDRKAADGERPILEPELDRLPSHSRGGGPDQDRHVAWNAAELEPTVRIDGRPDLARPTGHGGRSGHRDLSPFPFDLRAGDDGIGRRIGQGAKQHAGLRLGNPGTEPTVKRGPIGSGEGDDDIDAGSELDDSVGRGEADAAEGGVGK